MDLFEAGKRLQARGFFTQSGCADDATNRDMREMREAIAEEEARRQSARERLLHRAAFDALMSEITAAELSAICDAVVRLTALLQNECKHLMVENIAPEIMRNLLQELAAYKSVYIEVSVWSGG